MKVHLTKSGEMLAFFCPGCKVPHYIRFAPPGAPWAWNGDTERPTFSPSVLWRTGHYAQADKEHCWCTYNRDHPDAPAPFTCSLCHSFVRGGEIQFLSDCTHELAGTTMLLPDWE